MEALASRLVEARKNCGLTQAQVAEKLFLTTQSVSSWECGNSIPDTEKIPEIAALYGVTTDWLLSGRLPSAEILEVTSNLSDRLFSEARMATYVSAYCNAKKLYETKRALAFAKEKHNGQYRKPGHGDGGFRTSTIRFYSSVMLWLLGWKRMIFCPLVCYMTCAKTAGYRRKSFR